MSGKDVTIGIVGCGNMGAAFTSSISRHLPQWGIILYDIDTARQEGVVRRLGGRGASSLEDLIEASAVVLIAVKPQDIDPVLAAARGRPRKLVISIAAGIPLTYLERALAGGAVVRAMPNLNALIGRSVTALSFGPSVSAPHQALAKMVLEAVGAVVVVPDGQMNAVTAVSGSGPAFVAYLKDVVPADEIARVMIKAAQELGIEKGTAQRLAHATVSGTLAILSVNFDAPTLIKRVSSKGGTTEAGMDLLENEGKTPQALIAAIHAACRRAGELSKEH